MSLLPTPDEVRDFLLLWIGIPQIVVAIIATFASLHGWYRLTTTGARRAQDLVASSSAAVRVWGQFAASRQLQWWLRFGGGCIAVAAAICSIFAAYYWGGDLWNWGYALLVLASGFIIIASEEEIAIAVLGAVVSQATFATPLLVQDPKLYALVLGSTLFISIPGPVVFSVLDRQ